MKQTAQQGMKGSISAVVLSFNSARDLDRCLGALTEALDTLGAGHEIWVVENGSGDASPALLRQWVDRRPDLVRPIFSPVNLGTTASRNRALAQARGDYVLVLDSDAYVDAEALRGLRQYLAQTPTAGLVAPLLRYGDGRFQLSADEFPTFWRKVVRMFYLRKLEQAHAVPPQPTEVDYAISACWLLPMHVVRLVGPLDERIFYSPEDVDYCIRVGLGGYAVIYNPNFSAVHDAQELSRSKKLNGFFSRHLLGMFYLFFKHRYFLSARGLRSRIAKAPLGRPQDLGRG
jgi:GT2 family glycosyltransferase